MDRELNKINFYFEEGRRLWQTEPERAASREFYEMWESIQKPLPFIVKDYITLLEILFDLDEPELEKTAYFNWHPAENCPALTVESREWQKHYLLIFNDGEPYIIEQDMEFFDNDELSLGERLEIIYDVIAWLRKNSPDKTVLDITKKEFVEAMQNVETNHEAFAVGAMKRTSARYLKLLIRKATADMAADELSSQLSLPLDGGYSVGEKSSIEDFIPTLVKTEIPARTPWNINYSLQLQLRALELAAENDRDFVLHFGEAKQLARPGRSDLALRIPATPDMPLVQGDFLNVFMRGERTVFGTFKVDIFDGDSILGRMRCDHPAEAASCLDRLFARLQRSPSRFLAEEFDQLSKGIAGRKVKKGNALRTVLGFDKFVFEPGNVQNAPGEMDASQQAAWAAATAAANPVVLIQGPPGTGKTFVLEKVVRELCRQGKRILITAPSNTAVDNICRRIINLPVLRFGKNRNSIAPDVAEACWIGEPRNVNRFVMKREQLSTGGIYAGTHVGLLRDGIVKEDQKQNGPFDAIIFDEAGMANMAEFLLCVGLGKRVLLFGDHQQLPPFPLPENVRKALLKEFAPLPCHMGSLVSDSALQWLAESRKIPVIMLQQSYRCQNPRLLRFASTLFYDAGVRASSSAEYYQLDFHERKSKYPVSTLRFFSTSELSLKKRSEHLSMEGQKPGVANPAEAYICLYAFYQMIKKYPLEEISIIAPYRRQVGLIRDNLSLEKVSRLCPEQKITARRWKHFLLTRVATVDSFQGGESDVVIICYVRSNKGGGIGFVDNPNRINVAHTRCRREIIITGDLKTLKAQAGSNIFRRMERAFYRDGEIIQVTDYMLEEIAGTIAATLG
ncbi:AAA domain-containing protein [Lentisphaerota bacterium ZTH]|nr:AAA family ATPase [Lentisphaerota bacterium]WET06341.1 AAA domain-containing protein [Lentisphaerota bacterium ZTH]